MTCDSFENCITTDPLVGTEASERYQHIGNILITAINFLAAVLWSLLLVYVVYSLANAIYRLILARDEETYKVLQESFMKVIFGVVGMLFIYGARFILATILGLLGIASAENVFINTHSILLPWH